MKGYSSKIGLIAGIVIFFLVLQLPLDINFNAKLVLATTLLMCSLWITEALPIYVTSLLPLIIFQFDKELANALIAYADRIIFLFLGGFILALSIDKYNLHKRLAFNIIKRVGNEPKRIIGAIIISTGILSAWMSNTAVAMVMLPIALAIVSLSNNRKFTIALLLSIAYAANLGGMATLVGTPPNAIFASLANKLLNIEISFSDWLIIGVPVSIITLLITWFYLTNIGIKLEKSQLDMNKIFEELKSLGNINRDEKIIIVIFLSVIITWITRGVFWGKFIPFIDDSSIAIIASIILFVIPNKNGKRLLEWSDTKKIPWGVLLLMGSGLSLASGFNITGLDLWIAKYLYFEGVHYIIIILLITTLTIFTNEIMSNTAMASLFIPIGIAVANNLNLDPLALMITITLSASCGFAIPVGTPPNALIFSTGYIPIRDMIKIGLQLDLMCIGIITLASIVIIYLL